MKRPPLASVGNELHASNLLKRWGFLLLLLGLSCQPKPPTSELHVIAQVPDWQLRNQDGKDFGSNDLRGKVYLANFVFSRCPSVCPKMLQDTAKIQERLKDQDGLAILSFTVDPDYDTPEILAKLATHYGANKAVWSFVTHADKDALFALYRDGYKINAAPAQPPRDLYDIAHSEKLVLVDQAGQIRGYYGYEKETIDQLIVDATYLAKNPGAKL
jgi:protein SCO1/2